MTSLFDHQGAPQSRFQYSTRLYLEEEDADISLMGHKVVGSSIVGTLPCTGMTLWPAAELTSNFIASRSDGFVGKTVLEVGCGLGLCGIIAAKAVGSTGHILLTDGDAEVVELAQQNIMLNNVSKNASSATLRWGDVDVIDGILNDYAAETSSREPTTSVGANAAATHPIGCFDIVIASDCLYRNGNNTTVLFELAASMLKKASSPAVGSTATSNDLHDHSPADPAVGTASTEKGEDSLAATGDGGGWYYPSDHDHSTETNAEYTKHSDNKQPVFILAYTRRLDGNEASMDVIFAAAKEVGFCYEVAYDSVIDMFGNVTTERTLMWEHCVFLFTWSDEVVRRVSV